jgi:hypothetical protein
VFWRENPMVGSFFASCVRAARGHAATAPPSSVMNARRFTRSPRRRERAGSMARWPHGLDDAELSNTTRVGRIPNDRRSHYSRRDLLKQLQPFPGQAVFGDHETCGVAARPRQALDVAVGDRIGQHWNAIGTVLVASSNGGMVESPVARMTSGIPAASLTSGGAAVNSRQDAAGASGDTAARMSVSEAACRREYHPAIQRPYSPFSARAS